MTPEELTRVLTEHGIDAQLSMEILTRYNSGELKTQTLRIEGIPGMDGDQILDHAGLPSLSIPAAELRTTLTDLGLSMDEQDIILYHLSWLPAGEQFETQAHQFPSHKPSQTPAHDTVLSLSPRHYEYLGWLLLPLVSFGVLNGGSATSYGDETKNRGADPALFEALEELFHTNAPLVRGQPKGLVPGFFNPDGSPGPSFLILKLRAGLLMAKKSRELRQLAGLENPADLAPLFPFFQMTSKANTQTIAAAYRGYETHPLLQDLSTELGITISSWETGVQPMISAFTHSDEGEPRGIFLEAFGEANTPLPLPGGHGQNFIALKSVYNRLFDQGKRLVYLGNVDNLGFLPDPRSIGYLIVDGACAGFDFSFKTKVDTKGGILLSQQGGGLTCADIGPGISMEEVEKAEAQDKKILFNCATGLFRLDYLTKNLDRIIQDLPTRISDQKKDAGKYSQAEQVTWEVLALLDRFLVFGVNKFDRFLAAKLLTDTFLTSGLIPDGNQDGLNPEINPQVHDLSQQLHHGLIGLLSGPYGLTLRNGAWQAPETADQPS